jgi:predicted DNA-binding protein with PD1-like motif
MFFQAVEGGFIVRVERGEELVGALKTLMEREQIGSGTVTGLGATSFARLGIYDVEARVYVDRSFEGVHEICNLTGSLSWHDGAPFPHVHMILSDFELHAIGGHCFEAIAGATIEVFVRSFAKRVDREMDEDLGLHLLGLGGHTSTAT